MIVEERGIPTIESVSGIYTTIPEGKQLHSKSCTRQPGNREEWFVGVIKEGENEQQILLVPSVNCFKKQSRDEHDSSIMPIMQTADSTVTASAIELIGNYPRTESIVACKYNKDTNQIHLIEQSILKPLTSESNNSTLHTIHNSVVSFFHNKYKKKIYLTNCWLNENGLTLNIFTSSSTRNDRSFFRTQLAFKEKEEDNIELNGFMEIFFDCNDETYSGKFMHDMDIEKLTVDSIESDLSGQMFKFYREIDQWSVKCANEAKSLRRILPISKTKINWNRAVIADSIKTIQ